MTTSALVRLDPGFGRAEAAIAQAARDQFGISATILALFGLGCAIVFLA